MYVRMLEEATTTKIKILDTIKDRQEKNKSMTNNVAFVAIVAIVAILTIDAIIAIVMISPIAIIIIVVL